MQSITISRVESFKIEIPIRDIERFGLFSRQRKNNGDIIIAKFNFALQFGDRHVRIIK